VDETLGRFLIFNLGASVAAGLWGVVVVYGVTWAARLSSAETRNELLVLPLLKSTLVLLGLVTVMPFPTDFWWGIRAQALPFASVAPLFFIWTGLGLLGIELLKRRGARWALRSSEEVPVGLRPWQTIGRLWELFRDRSGTVTCASCVPLGEEQSLRLYLSDRVTPGSCCRERSSPSWTTKSWKGFWPTRWLISGYAIPVAGPASRAG
jgi:hypothetical protein